MFVPSGITEFGLHEIKCLPDYVHRWGWYNGEALGLAEARWQASTDADRFCIMYTVSINERSPHGSRKQAELWHQNGTISHDL